MPEIGSDGTYEIDAETVWGKVVTVDRPTFVDVTVEQLGVDLEIVWTPPNGAPAFTADSPIGSDGEEELVALLEPGEHRIEVVAPGEASAGSFRYITRALRPAAAEDEAHVRADREQRRGWHRYGRERAYREALAHYRSALAVWVDLDLARREAETLDSMAQAYDRLDETEVALALADRAVERGLALDSAHDLRQLSLYRIRAGVLRRKLGRPGEAVDSCFTPALALAERLGDAQRQVSALASRARSYLDLGAFQHALDDADRALGLEGWDRARRQLVPLLLHRAFALLELHAPEEASDAASRARELAQGAGERYSLRASSTLARALAQRGEIEQAAALATEILAGLRSTATPLELANGLQLLGNIERRRGRPEAAREYFEEALTIVREAGDAQREAVVLVELGYLDLVSVSPERGLERIREAQRHFRQLGDAKGLATANARSAEALRELGRLEDASERIEAAIEGVEQLRAATLREDVRMGFFAFRQEYYDIALDIAVRRWSAEPSAEAALAALSVHDRRLARELREGLSFAGTAGDTPGGDAMVERERAVVANLTEVIRSTAIGEAEREAEIDRLLAELARARGRERPAAELPPVSHARLESGQIDELFDPDTLGLVYALGPDRTVLWVLESGGASELHVLASTRRELEALAGRWRETLDSVRESSRPVRQRLGTELSARLLAPVADRLGTRRLAIVADGPLLTLPFAALPHPAAEGPDDYLVHTHEIVRVSSLAALAALRQASDRLPRQLRPAAIFADPVYGSEDQRLSSGARAAAGGTDHRGSDLERSLERSGFGAFSRLEHSGAEAAAVAQRMDPSGLLLALGFDASRETLLATDLGRYGILHFAAHAFVDGERPDLSGLVLSQIGPDGSARDGYLRGYEIANLELAADLVVLSACETARGKLLPGEGVLGLTRRFFEAGAVRVIASQWSVSDEKTALLMDRFYDALIRERRAPGEALRQAQLALIDDPKTADPYFWAAFEHQGDWLRPAGW